MPITNNACQAEVACRGRIARGDHFHELYCKARSWMVGIGFLIAFLLIGSESFLLGTAFGSTYASSGRTLSLLSLGLPFVFWSVLLGQALVACHKEKQVSLAMGAAVLLNILGNLWAIPHYGNEGAACTTVLTEMLNWIMLLYFLRKAVPRGTKHT